MARRISIPFLLDVVTADRPAEVAALAADPELDRAPVSGGPLINRLIAGRAARLLRVGSEPLPSARPQQDPERQRISQSLADRLNGDPALILAALGADLDDAAGFVSGQHSGKSGPMAIALCGKLFDTDFEASDRNWRASETIQAAISTRNPLKWIADFFTGRTMSAKSDLSRALGGDLAAVHAVGVASHNLAESLRRMRRLYAVTDVPDELSVERVLAETLAAPETVLRQSPGPSETPAGSVQRGTLVVLEVEAARSRGMDDDMAFLADSWSGCPARAFMPAMMAEIWRRAMAGEGDRQ